MYVTLGTYGRKLAEDAGRATFAASRNLSDQIPKIPKSLATEIDTIGAEVALAKILHEHPRSPDWLKQFLAKWNPMINVDTFGAKPDIAIGQGVEVRLIGSPNHCLTIRDRDHRDRIFVNMLGKFPAYSFAGFVVFDEIENPSIYRTNYGHPERETVWGFPSDVKNYNLEDLIERIEAKKANSPYQPQAESTYS